MVNPFKASTTERPSSFGRSWRNARAREAGSRHGHRLLGGGHRPTGGHARHTSGPTTGARAEQVKQGPLHVTGYVSPEHYRRTSAHAPSTRRHSGGSGSQQAVRAAMGSRSNSTPNRRVTVAAAPAGPTNKQVRYPSPKRAGSPAPKK